MCKCVCVCYVWVGVIYLDCCIFKQTNSSLCESREVLEMHH